GACRTRLLEAGLPFANFAQQRRQHLLGSLHAAIRGRPHAKDEASTGLVGLQCPAWRGPRPLKANFAMVSRTCLQPTIHGGKEQRVSLFPKEFRGDLRPLSQSLVAQTNLN